MSYGASGRLGTSSRNLWAGEALHVAGLEAQKIFSGVIAVAAEDPTMNLQTGYGFGFQVQEDRCGTSFGHNGGVPGASVTVRHWVDQGLTIAVLANVDRVAYPVARALEV